MSITTKMAGLRAMMAFTNRWQLIFNRLVFRSTLNVYSMHDTRFIVDHNGGDATGTRECIVSDMYRQYFRLLRLQGAITVVDIGANGGGFPLLLQVEGYAVKQAVCVEMNPNTFNRLRYNMYLNFGDRVECINAAVTRSAGTIELQCGAGSTADSIYQHGKSSSDDNKTYAISTVTLDQVLDGRFNPVLDILKMDIEGAEYEVLLNEGSGRLALARYLIMEIHDNPNIPKDRLIEKINSLGFTELLADSKKHKDVYCFANKSHVNV